MFSRITVLRFQKSLLVPNMVLTHSKTCPTQTYTMKSGGSGGSKPSSAKTMFPKLTRRERSARCHFGFLPNEWFTFFYPITGVTGPYLFGIGLINYLLSKEIYVMEHEYYLGLSIAWVVYYITTRFGRNIGEALDAEVDAIQAEWEKGRKDELKMYRNTIQAAKDAQTRAGGQKLLMEAKIENIAMQLEAVYRERMMHVYRITKGRMEYQAKKYRAQAKIQQKWMIEWILESVRKSITPEFEKQALDAAIRDLAAVAGKA